jgi:hypothetical protein
MRRLTVAVMVLGCLALVGTLLMPTAVSPIAATVSAEAACALPCSVIPGYTDKTDHFAFCHVDHGGAGHGICPDSSSIDQHLANHHFDQCITATFTAADCAAIKK